MADESAVVSGVPRWWLGLAGGAVIWVSGCSGQDSRPRVEDGDYSEIGLEDDVLCEDEPPSCPRPFVPLSADVELENTMLLIREPGNGRTWVVNAQEDFGVERILFGFTVRGGDCSQTCVAPESCEFGCTNLDECFFCNSVPWTVVARAM